MRLQSCTARNASEWERGRAAGWEAELQISHSAAGLKRSYFKLFWVRQDGEYGQGDLPVSKTREIVSILPTMDSLARVSVGLLNLLSRSWPVARAHVSPRTTGCVRHKPQAQLSDSNQT